MTRATVGRVYVDRVDRTRRYLTHHGLDVVVVLMALVAGASTLARTDPGRPGGPNGLGRTCKIDTYGDGVRMWSHGRAQGLPPLLDPFHRVG